VAEGGSAGKELVGALIRTTRTEPIFEAGWGCAELC